jgi:hypothetical protein
MSESSNLLPRRISSWKVFGIFCLISFLILFGIVFIPWDIKSIDDTDLQVQIPAIAPEENAFPWFEKAGKSLVFLGAHGDLSYLTVGIGTEYEKWDPVSADKMLEANAVIFPDLEKGLACQRIACIGDKPGFHADFYYHTALAKLLCLKSKQLQLSGNPTVAVKPALQMFRLGQMVSAGSCGKSDWHNGFNGQRLAFSRLENLVADARIQEPELQEILNGLNQWNSEAIDEGCRNFLRGEFIRLVRRLEEMKAAGESWGHSPSFVVRFVPYVFKLNMTNRDLATVYRHYIKSVDLPYTEIPKKSCLELLFYKEPKTLWDKGMFVFLPNSLGRELFFGPQDLFCVTAFRFWLQNDVAALRLKIALRLYEQKHGQLPDDLGALVPEFIKAMPIDPFSAKPYRYSKAKKLIWSVGPDGVDNDGNSLPGMIMQPYFFTSKYDAVMPLGTRELKPKLVQPPASK